MRGQVEARRRWAIELGLPESHPLFDRLDQLDGLVLVGGDPAPYLESIDAMLAQSEERPRGPWAPVAPEAIAGPFRLGYATHMDPQPACGLGWDALARGVYIPGCIGSGKTNAATRVACSIMDSGEASVIFFDPKSDYGWLARRYPDLDVYQEHNLRMNPFQPPEGMLLDLWLTKVAEAFSSSLGLMEGSRSRMTTGFRAVAAICSEASDEGRLLYPTMAHVRDYFMGTENGAFGQKARTSGPRRDYTERIAERFENLCDVLPRVATVSRGIRIDGSRSTVIDVSGIGKAEASTTISELITLGIYYNRLLQGTRPAHPDLIIIIDEAQQWLGEYEAWRQVQSMPPMEELATRARESGLGFIYLSQSPSSIRQSVRANVQTRIVFPLADGTDRGLMAAAMELDPRQREAMARLRTGEAVVGLQGLRPFPIRVEFEPEDKTFGIADVDAHMGRRMSEQEIVEAPDFGELWDIAMRRRTTARGPKQAGPELSSDEVRMLEFVLAKESQHIGRTQLSEQAPLAKSRAGAALDTLEKNGMAVVVQRKAAPGAGRGSIPSLYFLDNAGARYLGLDRSSHRMGRVGKGGWFHQTMLGEIRWWWRELGYEAVIEHPTGRSSETVDVLIEDPESHKQVAVEVECSSSDALRNVRKCLRAGFEEIWVVPKNSGVGKYIQRELAGDPELKKEAEGRVVFFQDCSHFFRRETL